jgi:hypothetical protein
MFKRLQELWGQLRRNQGRLKATVQVDFFPNKTARSRVDWHDAGNPDRDTVSLAIYLYARLLFELAEINETRVANELITFLSQVLDLVFTDAGPPNRPRLPMGELTLREDPPSGSPSRIYRADLFQLEDGQFRMDFKGALGKEGVYLPAAYVVFLQECINGLDDEALRRLARSLRRLHEYYRLRIDFWDSAALSAGPLFALGKGQLPPEEVVEE